MKAPSLALIPFALALTVLPMFALAQPDAVQPHYTHSELKLLMRNVHTTDQYQQLASYFRSQQAIYNSKAAAEKAEWDRRKAITASPALKYPSPADSARNLYDYYASKANQMASLAQSYEQHAR
jgi:hypothetical protein